MTIMTRSDFRLAIEEILELPPDSLQDTDSRDTIATWTSLADVKIITFISSEFGVEPEAELMEAETFGDLVKTLEGKGLIGG
jgi:acyl carrier protein